MLPPRKTLKGYPKKKGSLFCFQVSRFAAKVALLVLVVNVYVIATSAKDAVRIGRKLNNEQQKDNAKRNLFLLLFALRGNPTHYDFVRGLNQIDIVFEGVPEVQSAWHTLFDSLQIKNQANAWDNWERMRIALLSAMAVHLGYNRIQQTDITRHYAPEQHGIFEREDREFRMAALEYFRSGKDLHDAVLEGKFASNSGNSKESDNLQ